MRAFLLVFAVAGSLAAAVPAVAQSVSLRPYPHLDLAGFSGDAGALPTAVTNIESATGGRVIEIRYNNVSGVPGYDVVVAKGPQVRFQRYSKHGAAPIDLTEKTTPAWMLDWRAQRSVNLGEKAKVSLADAIHAAESSKNGAPAVAAGIARSASSPTSAVHAYNVSILQNGEQRRVAVDSQTGDVISDPGALTQW